MSIKDLFNNKPSIMASPNSASAQIESPDYVESLIKNRETYVPPIDFSKPENFIRFGLATEYYSESIKRIYNSYPYDGSEKEKQEFILNSSYLDRWMLDNKYPRHSGYAHFGYDSHVVINRGYKGATRPSYSNLNNLFDNKNTNYDSAKKRKHTLQFDLSDGVTFEWWMKKDGWNNSQETFLELTSSSFKLDILLSDSSNPIQLSASSGNVIESINVAASTLLSSSVADNSWHHYALSIINNSNDTNTETYFYVDGVLNNSITNHNLLSSNNGLITGYLGSGSFGLLSASVNEFRVWNKKQKSESIYYNYNRNIGGGSSTDDYRKELVVYYKFNEGSTLTSSVDRVVLDYSGRISNGYFENYVSSNRQSGSSFLSDESDPIIRPNNSLVIDLQSEMVTSGSNHDRNNNMKMYDLVHSWMRDEDEDSNQGLKKLTQIISSYFDTLYSQIEYLPDLRAKRYFQSTEKPLPFANRLLQEKGIIIPDVLVNSNVLEYFGNRDSNNQKYEKDFEDVKNLIYYNIYNNLDFILKSKGTEKSYRNFLRCFGIDDEVVKLNVYTDNSTQYLIDKTKHTSVKTKAIDFFTKDNLDATVYQENTVSGSLDLRLERNSAITAEVSTFIPRRLVHQDPNFFPINFLTASIFGIDSTTPNGLEYSKEGRFDSLEVVLAKTLNDTYSTDAKWMLRLRNHASGTVETILTSSVFQDIYENNEFWTVAVKIYPEGYPFAGSFATASAGNYKIDFYGVTHAFDDVKDSFSLSTTVSNATGSNLLSSRKRAFVGARRTNWSGSVVNYAETKINSFRLYYDKLENSTINQHNKDPFNYGQTKVFGNPTVFNHSVDNMRVPGAQSLAINWDFQTVTGSNSAGSFNVEDFSSGSSEGRYGWLENVITKEHRGVGFGFNASSTNVFNNEFVFASKKELPEISFTADNVSIVGQVDELLTEDDDVTDNLFAIEKSMYQVVSEEMMNMFSTMSEFSNLFIKPVDRYRTEYKRLNHIRQLFFERVSGSMDLETFTSYYKWIDGTVSHFLNQLHPAMSKFSPGISDMVESHILERPKYTHKFGFVRTKGQEEGVVKGVNELTYNWQFGHSPEYKNGGDNDHCLWQKERREPSSTRSKIQSAIVTHTTGVVPEFGDNNSEPYAGSAYAIKRFSKPYSFGGQEQKTIFGGINYERTKDRDLLRTVTQVHGPKSNIGVPTDVVVLGVGEGLGIETVDSCQDVDGSPNQKRKYGTGAIIGRFSNFDGSSPISGSGLKSITAEYNYRLKGQRIFPFNLMSGSEPTGYNKKINDSYANNAILTNLHSDTTTPTNEIPMQGPFTQTWVGGRQSRHVPLNRGTDGETSRPEEYRILIGDHPDEAVKDGALGITGPDYGGPYPDTTRPWAIHYRDERAKRPVNLANRKRTSQVEGNYAENYEIVSVVGRKENNLKFREFESTTNYLPSDIKAALPETTHPMTLIGISTNPTGNVFGQGETTNINDTTEIVDSQQFFSSGSFEVTGATQKDFFYSSGSFQVTGATDALYNVQSSFSVYYPPPITDGDVRPGLLTFVVSGTLEDASLLNIDVGATSLQIEADSNSSTDAGTDYTLSFSPSVTRRFVRGTGINLHDSLIWTTGDYGSLTFDPEISTRYSFWMNLASTSASFEILQEEEYYTTAAATTYYYQRILFFNSSTARFTVQQEGQVPSMTRNYTRTATSDWRHYYFDGNNLYENGELLSYTGGTASVNYQNNELEIRLRNRASFFDLTFWERALSQDEIRELYNSGSALSDISNFSAADAVLLHWDFGDEDKFGSYTAGTQLTGSSAITLASSTGSYNAISLRFERDPIGGGSYDLKYDVDDVTFNSVVDLEGLQTYLNSNISGWTTTTASIGDKTQFFIEQNAAASSSLQIEYTGKSFGSTQKYHPRIATNQHSSSNLVSGHEITVDGNNITLSDGTISSSNSVYYLNKPKAICITGSRLVGNPYEGHETNTFSVSAWLKSGGGEYDWFYIRSNQFQLELQSKDDLSGNGMSLVYGDYPLGIDMNTYDMNWTDLGITPGDWFHYTITKGSSNLPTVYINGVSSSFSSAFPAGSQYNTISSPMSYLRLGSYFPKRSGSCMFDFATWDKELTQDEVRIIYNSGSQIDPILSSSVNQLTSSLVNWYRFSEELYDNENNSPSGSTISNNINLFHPYYGTSKLDLETLTGFRPKITYHDKADDIAVSSSVFVDNFKSKLQSLGLAHTHTTEASSFTLSRTSIEASGSLSSTASSFSNINVTSSGIVEYKGATDGDYLQIENTRFYIDYENINATGSYAKVGNNYYVYSSGSNTDFWNRLSGALGDEFGTSYTVHKSYGALNAIFSITASSPGATTYKPITENGSTYTLRTNISGGWIKYKGAFDGDYLQIGTTRFYIDDSNSNATGSYAKVGNNYYVYSSGSNANFWSRLSGALGDEFGENYSVSASYGDTSAIFSITASNPGHETYKPITENGISYTLRTNISGGHLIPIYEQGYVNVTQVEPDFITGSTRQKTVIASRFSAPGGPEVQTYGFLDAYAHEYSVHNAITYRNLSVRGDSGETGTIRVNSPASRREGLNTLHTRHCGKFGIDSTHGSVSSVDYSAEASFHKVHRNTSLTPITGSVELNENHDNFYVQSILPQSDYNYSWISSSLGSNYSVRSETQKVFGYWPKNGINKVNGVFDSAITFPTASEIQRS